MVDFSELGEDGEIRHVRTLPQASIASCPHTIFSPEHYPEGSERCGCFNPDDPHMAEWGYVWNNGRKQWTTPPEPRNV
jgi:hypothetical protein